MIRALWIVLETYGGRMAASIGLGLFLVLGWAWWCPPDKLVSQLAACSNPHVIRASLAINLVCLTFWLAQFFPSIGKPCRFRWTIPAAFAYWVIALVTATDDQQTRLLSNALMYSLLGVGPMIMIVVQDWMLSRRRYRELVVHGGEDDATFCTHARYDAHACDLNSERWSDSIYLGMTRFEDDFASRHVAERSDVHLVTLGVSSSGKSATAIWPNLGKYGGPVLAMDPKGEHTLVTGRVRALLGPVRILDPFNVTGKEGSCYNPLDPIDYTTPEGVDWVEEIAAACIETETDTKNRHFSDNARTVLEGIIAHVVTAMPPEQRHLGTVYDIATSKSADGAGYDREAFLQFLDAMSCNTLGGDACFNAAKLLDDAGANESGSFLTTLQRGVKWMRHPRMRNHFSRSDFSLSDLASDGPEKTTVYVVLPFGKEERYAPWRRIIARQTIAAVTKQFQRTNTKLSPSLLLLLDEFPKYGAGMEELVSGFGTLREVGIKLWVHAQSLGQLRNIIPKGLSVVLANSTVQVLSVHGEEGEKDTSSWVSAKLGSHHVAVQHADGSVSNKQVRLMSERAIADELKQKGDNQVVFCVNELPMRLRRMAYTAFLDEEGRMPWKPLPLGPIFDSPRL